MSNSRTTTVMLAAKISPPVVSFNNGPIGSLIGGVSINPGASVKTGTYHLVSQSVKDDANDSWRLIISCTETGYNREFMVYSGNNTFNLANGNELIQGLSIQIDTPENDTSATITIADTVIPSFISTDNGVVALPVSNAMKVVKIRTSATPIADAGELITFDCRGFSSFSLFINSSSGTAPSTIEIHGGIQNQIRNNTTFAKCSTPNTTGNGPSSIFIGSLTPADGIARTGPRQTVSHPFHALYLAGGTTFVADIWVTLHTNGSTGGG